MAINALRHQSVFDPDTFGKRRVDVIGAGATGSRIVLQLAKLGVANIHVWDFDKVEAHNIANQLFPMSSIGKLKVDAIKALINEQAGMEPAIHNEAVDGSQKLGEVVFLLTDTMDSRKKIWNSLKLKLSTKLLIETRMGIDEGRIYAVNPSLSNHIKAYEATLYDSDKVAQKSACGASITVGATADVLAGYAIWQFVRWVSDKEIQENEIIYTLRPPILLSRMFRL